jgi:hypothetical protein
MTGMEFFYYVKAADCYPNTYVLIRFYIITLPVTSPKRSLSKLKLLKNHLRSTIVLLLYALKRNYLMRFILRQSSLTLHL